MTRTLWNLRPRGVYWPLVGLLAALAVSGVVVLYPRTAAEALRALAAFVEGNP